MLAGQWSWYLVVSEVCKRARPRRLTYFQAVVAACSLLAASLAFQVLLTGLTLDGLYLRSVASQYRLVLEDRRQSLEGQLRFHKALEADESMLRTLERDRLDVEALLGLSSGDIHLTLLDGKDQPIWSSAPNDFVAELVSEITAKELALRTRSSNRDWEYAAGRSRLHVLLPLRDVDDEWAGALVATGVTQGVVSRTQALYEEVQVAIAVTLGIGLLLLLTSVVVVIGRRRAGPRFSPKMYSAMAVLFLTQVVVSGLCLFCFSQQFLQSNERGSTVVVNRLQAELAPLIESGVPLRFVADLDSLLVEYLELHPALLSLRLTTPQSGVLASASQDDVGDFEKTKSRIDSSRIDALGLELSEHITRTIERDGNTEVVITATLSKQRIVNLLVDAGLELLTVLVVALLLTGEITILAVQAIGQRLRRPPLKSLGPTQRPPARVNFTLIRPATFMFLFGIDISMSFVPLHMERLYEPIFGLSKEFVIGLPISVEFAFVGLSLLIAGYWVDRRGWQEPFLAGLALAAVGVFCSSMSTDAIAFIASRGIVGCGYGLALMAAQGFVIQNTDAKNKTQGLAHVFAGLYAGSMCGSAIGAILADRIDYTDVFRIGGVVLVVVLLYTIASMRHTFARPNPQLIRQKRAEHAKALGAFFSNRRVLSVVLFASLPASIAVVGFLNYFTPVYLHSIGASQAAIGQVLLVYGVLLVTVGPRVSRIIDATGHQRLAVFVGSVLGGAAFASFQAFEGTTAAVIGMILMGLSSCLVLSAQSALLLSFSVSKALGDGKALGYFRATSRVGQILGPLVFAAMTLGSNLEMNIAYFGAFYLICSLVFYVLSAERRSEREGLTAPRVQIA